MLRDDLKNALRFYFLTDERSPVCPMIEQVKIALQAGAGMIQFRHKSFSTALFEEVRAIRNLCRCNRVPFLVNDDILLAKAVAADGVHLGQGDEDPQVARRILGPEAIVGVSVSNLEELRRTDLTACDYIGTGPVFATRTKEDAKPSCGLAGLKTVVDQSPLPVVAIGGIDDVNARSCIDQGAAGVAVISCISRAADPCRAAERLAAVCGCAPRPRLFSAWRDEFGLIDKLLTLTRSGATEARQLQVPPGDDACLLRTVPNPVITTDTQKEGVHFRLDWQPPEAVGRKAVAVTLSDLAACYARPVCLFINLGLPPDMADETVEGVYRGVNDALLRYRCELGGGNISRSAEFSLDLFAVGQGRDDLFPTRAAARPGFGLYVTGPLGLARAGLDLFVRKDLSFKPLRDRFTLPVARFDAAQVLARHRVPCAIDVSDGLAGDAAHIAEASGLTIAFDLSGAAPDPALAAYCEKYQIKTEDLMLAGGEDYELLFACPPESFDQIRAELPTAFQVGRCLAFSGRHLSGVPEGIVSFQHGFSLK